MENLPVQLNHRLRKSVQENALHCTDLLVVVGVVLQVGGAEGESAVQRMLVMVRAGAVDFLVVSGIHEDLAGSCEQDMRIGGHLFDDGADTVWRVIIIVIHDDDDIPRCLLGEVVELFAHRKLLVAIRVAEMVGAVVLEDVADGVRAVIEDEPFHQVMIVVLPLVDIDESRDEAGPVVGRCDDGDEHVLCCVTLGPLKFKSRPHTRMYRRDQRHRRRGITHNNWRRMKENNVTEPVYIPVGHGEELLDRPRKYMPEGCSLTVIETCGGEHYWSPAANADGEIFELTQLRTFLRKNPDQKYIFSNPKENVATLNDIFGSVAVYGPGEKYPNIHYRLELSWLFGIEMGNIRYSGLIPFDTFVSPEFTTKNIVERLLIERGKYANIEAEEFPNIADLNREEYKDIWLQNNLEIYKYSIYPSPDTFQYYFGSEYAIERIFGDSDTSPHDIGEGGFMNYYTHAKSIFMSKMDSKKGEGFIKVSLETLMEKFPGHYIHMVCRGIGRGVKDSTVKAITREEIFTKRIPQMTPNQKWKAMALIQEGSDFLPSFFNQRSTKRNNAVRLLGLKRSVVQNELLKKVPRVNGGTRRRPRHKISRQIEQ